MRVLYFALLSEAIYFIEKLKATKISSDPKIYQKDDILVVIGGVGEKNTIKSVNFIFQNYKVDYIYNIGVAGTLDKSIKIGSLFCTTHKLPNIKFANILTTNYQLPTHNKLSTTNHPLLLDMEAKFLTNIAKKYISEKNIYIFKIISDYNDTKKLNKEFIKQLIIKNFNIICDIICG